MIRRNISEKVLAFASQYPVVTITGPRQSGKTTLCKMIFPQKAYVSLEDVDERLFAKEDPRGFLNRFPEGAIIDEIQREPDLISYIQTIVDLQNTEGLFILTGSQQFDLMQTISQSLAGRSAIVKLLPFSYDEAYKEDRNQNKIEPVLFKGFYPRIFDKNLDPTEAMQFYVNTYVERDLRRLINIKDLSQFENFLKLCAGRTGQILNLSSLGNDCGINHNTVKAWISVLEASYIIKLLKPFYKNFNKRLIKAPKIYFLDTGLASYLLGITNIDQVFSHPLKGALFETYVFSELLKARYNKGKTDNLYFYRDSKGNEVDIICDNGSTLWLIEIKSGQTVSSDHFKGLRYFSKLCDMPLESYLIYGGDKAYTRNKVQVINWQSLPGV
ncbi:MAG: ATP-binding protein [Proteobacteria bacterium]|nr:ATP-binding protein [Pseudomonadota bacterium]MBU1586125.1 ATP-binding protein [Pseudomonadota bacterium]MBU2627380.1 ATP-binding protein [Pseudomonadota bacterium]